MSSSSQGSDSDACKQFNKLQKHLEENGACYARDEAGALNIIVHGSRIRIDYSRDNHGLAALFWEICGQSTLSRCSHAAIQLLQIEANRNLGRTKIRRFSAMSDDGNRLYLPITTGDVLVVSSKMLDVQDNGINTDSIWLEHPYAAPLDFPVDPNDGYELFEKLLVETQACAVDAMRWLVAMNEGLFCFIRDLAPARFIMEHIGPSQAGKTTAAQRFTLLHGLGNVKGDFSVAALNNIGDIGLLVMDNKEQANLTGELVDYLLFLATGGERGRSYCDGRMRPTPKGRPLGVITTIEGVIRPELQHRVVPVYYERKPEALSRGSIEQQITTNRHTILNAIACVLERYFSIRGKTPSPSPVNDFEEHFAALCDLLRAWGDVTSRPPEWAESIIAEWVKTLSEKEEDDDDLEYPIQRTIDQFNDGRPGFSFVTQRVTWEGESGTLFVTEPAKLLGMLHSLTLKDIPVPKNPSGLGHRLSDGKARFHSFRYLPTDTPATPVLRRQGNRRPIGFFVPG